MGLDRVDISEIPSSIPHKAFGNPQGSLPFSVGLRSTVCALQAHGAAAETADEQVEAPSDVSN